MDQGHIKAQYNLGVLYEKGYGVPQDYSKAGEWYQKAASYGHVSAQYNLGVVYHSGLGVAQDYFKAAEWYQKAAEQGHTRAQLNLDAVKIKNLSTNDILVPNMTEKYPQIFHVIYRDNTSGAITPLLKTIDIELQFGSKTEKHIVLWDDIKAASNDTLDV
ncbi:hypothetical protein BGZ79_004763 [Entomortierella chlamydospora]|nr:hypothetical protein BGZ79_004763 [Entomortierella chlamydospora]